MSKTIFFSFYFLFKFILIVDVRITHATKLHIIFCNNENVRVLLCLYKHNATFLIKVLCRSFYKHYFYPTPFYKI